MWAQRTLHVCDAITAVIDPARRDTTIASADNIIIVLNKTDLLAAHDRAAAITRMQEQLRDQLRGTKFACAHFAAVAAAPGSGGASSEVREGETADGAQLGRQEASVVLQIACTRIRVDDSVFIDRAVLTSTALIAVRQFICELQGKAIDSAAPIRAGELVQLLRSCVTVPPRSETGPFCMAVDHCFALRGQGTVLTGTVLSGVIATGQVTLGAHNDDLCWC
jgi:hypothetical protein